MRFVREYVRKWLTASLKTSRVMYFLATKSFFLPPELISLKHHAICQGDNHQWHENAPNLLWVGIVLSHLTFYPNLDPAKILAPACCVSFSLWVEMDHFVSLGVVRQSWMPCKICKTYPQWSFHKTPVRVSTKVICWHIEHCSFNTFTKMLDVDPMLFDGG